MADAQPAMRLLYLPGGDLSAADDETLVRAMVEGSPQAPRVAWMRFAPMVQRMLKRAFGRDEDTDDMLQDVFLCLFRKIGGLREPKALKAFVIAITARTIKYEARRRRSRGWLHLSRSAELEDPRTEQPDSSAREALRRFYEILDRLNPHDRTAFTLRFLEGLELAEVAAALDISVATTKRHLTRIWKRVTLFVERTPELASYLTAASQSAPGAELPEGVG